MLLMRYSFIKQLISSNQILLNINNSLRMTTPTKNLRHKQIQQVINRFGFLNIILNPQTLMPFKQILELIFSKIVNYSFKKDVSQITNNVSFLMSILHEKDKQVSLNSTVKKLAIIHNLVHKFSVKQIWFEQLANVLSKETYKIMKEDIAIMLNLKKKRSSSFTQAYNYLRGLSGSKRMKEKQQKLDIQTQTDKGTVRQIITKIIEPLCLYILKVIGDQQLYSVIMQKNQQNLSNQINWKIINWSRGLGDIVLQLTRLARYFRKDLLGIIVFLVYVLSIDLSIFFQRLKIHIYRQSIFWHQKIEEVLIKNNQMNRHYSHLNQQLINNASLMELKDLIRQVKQIEEKLQFLYFNKLWKNSKKQFARSRQITGERDEKYDQCLDDIQRFIEESENTKNRFSLYRDIKKERNDISIFNQSVKTLATKQTNEDSLRENVKQRQRSDFQANVNLVDYQLQKKSAGQSRKISLLFLKKNLLKEQEASHILQK